MTHEKSSYFFHSSHIPAMHLSIACVTNGIDVFVVVGCIVKTSMHPKIRSYEMRLYQYVITQHHHQCRYLCVCECVWCVFYNESTNRSLSGSLHLHLGWWIISIIIGTCNCCFFHLFLLTLSLSLFCHFHYSIPCANWHMANVLVCETWDKEWNCVVVRAAHK